MTRDEMMAIMMKRYEEFEKLKGASTFYDFEKEFEKLWIEVGRELMQASLGEAPTERRKKKDSSHDSAS